MLGSVALLQRGVRLMSTAHVVLKACGCLWSEQPSGSVVVTVAIAAVRIVLIFMETVLGPVTLWETM